MKRVFVLLIIGLVTWQISSSQDLWKRKRLEVVAGLGTTQYFGDIGGFTPSKNLIGLKDISFRQTRFNLNTQVKYRIIREVSAKVSLTYGIFHATDVRGSNEGREMEATTSFFEPALIGEYYFIKSKNDNSYLASKGRKIPFKSVFSYLDVYAFTGVGGLGFSVKGNPELVSRGMVDGGFTAVIPVGVGTNVLFRPDFDLGIELGGRYAFSDYLDGYTSQYSKSNDVYYFLNFTFTYRIPTKSNGIPEIFSRNVRRRR
jgi:hypothetical protein